MSVVNDIIGVVLVFSIPFLLGVATGVEIMKRRKEALSDAEAELGRTFNQIIDQTVEPLRFTGSGVKVTRIMTITRKGADCRVTIEAGDA